jgi:hypothetical protein
MQVFIYCKITLYMFRVSIAPIIRIHKTVTAASGTGHSNNIAATFFQRGQFDHVGRRLLLYCYYGLYQSLQLQFYVLLTMGALGTRKV